MLAPRERPLQCSPSHAGGAARALSAVPHGLDIRRRKGGWSDHARGGAGFTVPLRAFRITDYQLMIGEIDILDAETDAFHEA